MVDCVPYKKYFHEKSSRNQNKTCLIFTWLLLILDFFLSSMLSNQLSQALAEISVAFSAWVPWRFYGDVCHKPPPKAFCLQPEFLESLKLQ